ncbi:unnamed protein product [Parnassius apollo]|uniref:(apollo) hypothetical protein n=1 Tax=Parnassius apollo TaxID=110799 RepID=A0A8S3W861_PARAO|nr:unnamed protein product [Parnassius apollo]
MRNYKRKSDRGTKSVELIQRAADLVINENKSLTQHFIKRVRPSKEFPILLVLDNRSSHLSVPTLDLAKENGVVMLSFPPHCSHKLQPLDVSVYGPFKRYLSSAQDAWMRNKAGKTMTIYDIPGIVRTSLPLALTPSNIMSGFEKTGIFPFNQHKFNDADFASSYVTDRPMETVSNEPQPSTSSTPPPTILSNPQPSRPLDSQPSTSYDAQISISVDPHECFSPEIVRPLPKAGPRNEEEVFSQCSDGDKKWEEEEETESSDESIFDSSKSCKNRLAVSREPLELPHKLPLKNQADSNEVMPSRQISTEKDNPNSPDVIQDYGMYPDIADNLLVDVDTTPSVSLLRSSAPTPNLSIQEIPTLRNENVASSPSNELQT